MRVLVAGFGNPLRGDDGAGWRVVEALEERWGDRVQTMTGQQVLPEWAATLAEVDLAILVDVQADLEEVQVERLDTALDPGAPRTPAGAHALGPLDALRMARDLFGRVPETYLVAVPARQFDYGDDLSQETRRAVDEATRRIEAMLVERLGE